MYVLCNRGRGYRRDDAGAGVRTDIEVGKGDPDLGVRRGGGRASGRVSEPRLELERKTWVKTDVGGATRVGFQEASVRLPFILKRRSSSIMCRLWDQGFGADRAPPLAFTAVATRQGKHCGRHSRTLRKTESLNSGVTGPTQGSST